VTEQAKRRRVQETRLNQSNKPSG